MRCLLFLALIQLAALSIEKREIKRIVLSCIFISCMCMVCIICRSETFSAMYMGIGGAQKYLEGKGLRIVDLGAALVVYEAIGFLIMLNVWWLCFVVQPVKNGLLQPIFSLMKENGPAREGTGVIQKADNLYQGFLSFSKRNFEGIARRIGVDPVRLTASYAEGSVLRSLLKPVLMPAKLYMAYSIVTSQIFKVGFDKAITVCPW